MRKLLKWIGIVLGSLVGLLLLAAIVLYALGSARLNKTHDIQAETIPIPAGEQAIARGRHLAEAVTFCQACHGEDLGGDVLDDEPGIATISASNLTSGRGGVGATYTDADYVRSIRHGVNPQGRGLLIMHSDIYHNLSQQDLGAIIAYIRAVPPVDNEVPQTKTEPLGRIFVRQLGKASGGFVDAKRWRLNVRFDTVPLPSRLFVLNFTKLTFLKISIYW